MKFALIVCNEIIGMLFESIGNEEKLMIINGIRQKCVKGDGFFIYRQKDPSSFFKNFGIKAIDTEQNMTNDGILIFDNLFNRDAAINILKNISLKSNQKILDVEILDDRKVFYQLNIKSKIKTDEMILLNEKSFKFYDLIECICERTGAHIQNGDVFYQGFKLPAKIYNHEICSFLSSSLIHK